MKSNKQRRVEILAARKEKRIKHARAHRTPHPAYGDLTGITGNIAPVDLTALRPNNSYGCPLYVKQGYYQDIAFVCKDCGAECLWTAQRQKWWYEVAKGGPDTTAVRCKPCRIKERARKAAARATTEAGQARKSAAQNPPDPTP